MCTPVCTGTLILMREPRLLLCRNSNRENDVMWVRVQAKAVCRVMAVCAMVACMWLPGVASAEDLNMPWSVDDQCPVVGPALHSARVASSPAVPEEMGRACAYAWLKIYQDYLSVVIISHCPLYPSCSNYSIQAIRRYGSMKGIMMTADRLIHEWTEELEAPVIQVGGRTLCYDPIESGLK